MKINRTKLKLLREVRGLTQEGLAEIAGKTETWYAKIENGQSGNPTIKTLGEVIKALNSVEEGVNCQSILDL